MSQWGGTSGSAVAVGVERGARPKPRPRLVLRGQLHLQRREVLGAVGQPEGTGQDGEGASGQHAGQGSRESHRVEVCVCLSWPPWLNQSGPSRLSHRAADRERIEGARLLGLQHLLPTFLEGWRRSRSASGNGVGGLDSPLDVSPECPASSFGSRQVLHRVGSASGPCSTELQGAFVPPTLSPSSLRSDPPTLRPPVPSLPSHGVRASAHLRPSVGPYLAGRVVPVPACLPQPGRRRRFYRRA